MSLKNDILGCLEKFGPQGSAQIAERLCVEVKQIWNKGFHLKRDGLIVIAGRGRHARWMLPEQASDELAPAAEAAPAALPAPRSNGNGDFTVAVDDQARVVINTDSGQVLLTPALALRVHAFLERIEPILREPT